VWRIVIALSLVGLVLLVWFERREPRGRGERAPAEADTTASAPESDVREKTRPLNLPPQPEREPIAFQRGRVFDPRGRPIRRASVYVLKPEPMRLAWTDAEGNYELPLYERVPHLLEAELHIDLAPARERIKVPPKGDPPPLDFHLKPTGTVYGEVVADGAPVHGAWVDILADGKRILDTETDNGFFNFTDPPPEGAPLELSVATRAGYSACPIRFTWKGQPLDLGTIELRSFPSARVLLVLPDGSETKDFDPMRNPALEPGQLLYGGDLPWNRLLQYSNDLVYLDTGETEADVVLGHFTEEILYVRKRLRFAEGGTALQRVAVQEGPLTYAARLVDREGLPVRLRLRVGDEGPVVESDPEGRLRVRLSRGGLHFLEILAIQARELGFWTPLFGSGTSYLVLDAEDPAKRVTVDFSRRILVVSAFPSYVEFKRVKTGKHAYTPHGRDIWQATVAFAENRQPHAAFLSPRMADGAWHWVAREFTMSQRGWPQFRHPPSSYREWPSVRFRRRGLTVLDAR
jgi:hypothetical protein